MPKQRNAKAPAPSSLLAGRSKSAANPYGKRRWNNGLELAPQSLRRIGKHYINECSEEELKRAGVAVPREEIMPSEPAE